MYKILAVDDESHICAVLHKFLSMSGFKVFTGNCGEEALSILERENPDLLIVDKKMPGIGGMGVLAELRKKGSRIPIILLTGSYTIQEDIYKMACSNPAVLIKPVDLNILLNKVNSLLGAG
jgi:DNA-binding response OmpR family regulator